MKKVPYFIFIIIILSSACSTYYSVVTIENNITGSKHLPIKKPYSKLYLTNDEENIFYIKYKEKSDVAESILLYNLQKQTYKEVVFNENIFFQKFDYNLGMNVVGEKDFLIESIIIKPLKDVTKIIYTIFSKTNKIKDMEFEINSKIWKIQQSNIDKHRFLITYPNDYNRFSIIYINNDGITKDDYDLLLYNKKGYHESRNICLSSNDNEIIVRGFDSSNNTIISIYNFVKKEICKEIVFDLSNLTEGFGLFNIGVSPHSKYLYLIALKHYNFLFDLEKFELIKLPTSNLKGYKDIFLLSWLKKSKLLLEINDNVFIVDINNYIQSNPPTFQLNSEYFWEL